MRKLTIFLLALLASPLALHSDELKPRLVVMTDIGPADVEPDDNESAVRLLAYADRFEIEGIFTTTGWNCDPYPAAWADYMTRVVDAYAIDVRNLMRRSQQTDFLSRQEENGQQTLGYWPSADYIRSRTMMGSSRAGVKVIGEGNDSPGSNLLIRLADEDDPRPIWIATWGGANTLAQAIWRVAQTRSREELRRFVRKFRIYTITDQDMQWSMRALRAYSSHQWMRRTFCGDLLFVWDESAWLNQCDLGVKHWDEYARLIQGKGAMGNEYPKYKWGVEGDTPSFLHIMPNGLNDPEQPEQVGWGGYHTWALSPDSVTYAWTNWQQPQKDISDAYEKRFYPDEFSDFAARMAWAEQGKGNTNPVVVVNGSQSTRPLVIKAKVGDTITLDASASHDNEGDALAFLWWQQTEIGVPVAIDNPTAATVSITCPPQSSGKTLHMVCEVRDDGAFRLVSYRRVVVQVE